MKTKAERQATINAALAAHLDSLTPRPLMQVPPVQIGRATYASPLFSQAGEIHWIKTAPGREAVTHVQPL